MKTKRPGILRRIIFKWINGYDIPFPDDKMPIEPDYSRTGLDDTYLFDFKNFASGYNQSGLGFAAADMSVTVDPSGHTVIRNNNPRTKIPIKPIDALKELETIPTPFSLALLDEKIDIMRDKEKLITQHYAKREVTALIERLENRKKYVDFKDFFDGFQHTNEAKIAALLEKYDLVMKTSDIFIPEFPDEAIKIMKKYTKQMDLLCKKKPVFYVIAQEKDFKKALDKRDPILLVQSPFGFFYDVLGAWDSEMLLLSEL